MATSKEQRQQFQAVRTEFKKLSISELKDYEQRFVSYDQSKDGFIDLQELKYAFEKMGQPQTHLALKAMMKELDEDLDGKISYREFILLFVRAREGKLVHPGLKSLAGASVDVDKKGVKGAGAFFEQRAADLNTSAADADAAYHAQRKQAAASKAKSKAAFKAKAAAFQ